MSTFILPNSSPECQRSLATQISAEHTFHTSPYRLRKIEVQVVDYFGKGRIGFLKLQTDVSNDDGEKLPGCVFMRGGSVGMLVILQPDDIPPGTETEKQVILTIQPRIAAGSLSFSEIPAGMLDDSGTFSGGAAKEIQEETGLQVQESELIDMTALALSDSPTQEGEENLQQGVYPSPGGCDEYIPLFLYEKRIPRSQMREFQGKLTGLREEGERITLKLVRLERLWGEGARDGKTLAAWALYSGLKGEGKI
ncbi:ADP-sugar diphosphatase [Tothia fuscella]|uniref:ADP-sugar diphosphatase n=1 Tax=Tothia fuscella TaxID=1048955 RepID=A0A9P4TTN8_9PEZI|nr:ADP-sugar diphosphatase [Tothia fuscella]